MLSRAGRLTLASFPRERRDAIRWCLAVVSEPRLGREPWFRAAAAESAAAVRVPITSLTWRRVAVKTTRLFGSGPIRCRIFMPVAAASASMLHVQNPRRGDVHYQHGRDANEQLVLVHRHGLGPHIPCSTVPCLQHPTACYARSHAWSQAWTDGGGAGFLVIKLVVRNKADHDMPTPSECVREPMAGSPRAGSNGSDTLPA